MEDDSFSNYGRGCSSYTFKQQQQQQQQIENNNSYSSTDEGRDSEAEDVDEEEEEDVGEGGEVQESMDDDEPPINQSGGNPGPLLEADETLTISHGQGSLTVTFGVNWTELVESKQTLVKTLLYSNNYYQLYHREEDNLYVFGRKMIVE